MPRALEFLRSPQRAAMLAVMRDLPVMDGRDVLVSARELLKAVRAPLEDVKARQEGEMRERVEFMGRQAQVKDVEARNKRELTARERESVAELFAIAESWLRDALASSVGARRLDRESRRRGRHRGGRRVHEPGGRRRGALKRSAARGAASRIM